MVNSPTSLFEAMMWCMRINPDTIFIYFEAHIFQVAGQSLQEIEGLEMKALESGDNSADEKLTLE